MKLSDRDDLEEPGIHVAPLLDVIFLVLVAYIEATVLMTPATGLPIDLPRAETSERVATTELLRLVITADGTVFLDQQPLGMDELGEALAARRSVDPDVVLYVYADRGARVGRLVRVLDLSRKAGIRGLTLASEEGPERWRLPGPAEQRR